MEVAQYCAFVEKSAQFLRDNLGIFQIVTQRLMQISSSRFLGGDLETSATRIPLRNRTSFEFDTLPFPSARCVKPKLVVNSKPANFKNRQRDRFSCGHKLVLQIYHYSMILLVEFPGSLCRVVR